MKKYFNKQFLYKSIVHDHSMRQFTTPNQLSSNKGYDQTHQQPNFSKCSVASSGVGKILGFSTQLFQFIKLHFMMFDLDF